MISAKSAAKHVRESHDVFYFWLVDKVGVILVANSEAREWRHDSDKTNWNGGWFWRFLQGQKPLFLKHFWNENFAYIPCISLRTR